MKSKQHAEVLEQFVEDVGIAMEQSGFPRMAGKVLGYLLISHEQQVSTDELLRRLHASRGSISTMTRLLIQSGLIDRIGRPGERKDYFRIKGDTWSRILKVRMAQIVDLHHAIEHGLEWISPNEKQPYHRLRDMHEFYEFFEKEFQALLDRWEKRRK
jgi:DNA-binding transcriptional regulator GbsR (MarR family)